MSKLLKIDFHTHPIEALRDKMGIRGIRDINGKVAAAIVESIKSAGLNGIAITEHSNFNHSWVASLEILDHFRQENLMIFPGTEIEFQGQHYLHIFIPDLYRRRVPFFQKKEWFLILAHPGYYNPLDIRSIHEIQIDAIEAKSRYGEFPLAEIISGERNIPRILSSDAHTLEDIGFRYTELESR